LAEVIDMRDAGTAAHSETVGRYAGAIARELGLTDELVERVRFGGIVHDVGKIGISDAVLRKPGWLSDEDWAEMHRHPEMGAGTQFDGRVVEAFLELLDRSEVTRELPVGS